jgi:RimJ/RimL family protein N-acetyltransferase
MSDVLEGEKIGKILLQDGKEVSLQIPSMGDLEELLKYINKISKEDTYIIYSGEEITFEDEKIYLETVLKGMEEQDFIGVIAVYDFKIIGYSTLRRKTEERMRSRHIGEFGISVDSDFRGLGVGKKIAEELLNIAKSKLPELKKVVLTVYSENKIAHNLYTELGFKEYGVLPRGIWYKDRYIDAVLMYLDLEE